MPLNSISTKRLCMTTKRRNAKIPENCCMKKFMTSLRRHFLFKTYENLYGDSPQKGLCLCKMWFSSDKGEQSYGICPPPPPPQKKKSRDYKRRCISLHARYVHWLGDCQNTEDFCTVFLKYSNAAARVSAALLAEITVVNAAVK